MPILSRGALWLGLLVAALLLSWRLVAQIEGDRGIAALAVSNDISATGIEVNTTGKSPLEARAEGWKLATRKGWEQLHGPAMGDGQLDSLVTSVVVEHEQVGPHRYVARLTVVFDRARAGQYLGGGGGGPVRHSAPMLLVPVLISGGTAQVYEVRGPWQKAWAEFSPGGSAISYVRPSGANGDSLIVTAGQIGRRSRTWWRTVLDQFGAADVLVAVARLEREWPGGPVHGTFTARYGPDNTFLDSFTLDAPNEAGVPAMLKAAMVRLDQVFVDGLSRGLVRPDQSLQSDHVTVDPAIAALIAANAAKTAAADAPQTESPGESAKPSPTPSPTVAVINAVVVQFASPDAKALDAALAAVRGVSGVKSASTSSLAIGGTSVMRVSFAGDVSDLAAALRARGWSVSGGGNALSIKR